MLFVLRESHPRERRGQARPQSRVGLIRGALRRPVLSRLIMIFFLVILAFAAMESIFALWALRQLDWGPEKVGYVFAYLGLLSAIMQGGLTRRLTKRYGEERLLLCGLVLLAIGLVVVPFSRDLALLGGAFAVLAVGLGLTQPALNSLISRRAGGGEQGEVLGVTQSIGSLARVIGPPLAGYLFADLGHSSPFLWGAMLVALAFLLALNLFGGFGAAPARRTRAAARSGAVSRRGRPITPGPLRQKGRLKDEVRALRSLAPYLWPSGSAELRVRVVLAVGFLIAGRLLNISVPFLYKHAVDAVAPGKAVIAVPVALIVAYGLARVMAQGFNELRNAAFAKVTQRAVRRLALSAFRHVHALALRFHLERRTGGLVAGDRARHRRHRVPAVLSAVQHRPDLCRNPAGLRHPVAALQLDFCRRHPGDDRALHRLHLSGDRLAGALSPRHERAQQRGQHPRDRQPVEFRDRQIFRQ